MAAQLEAEAVAVDRQLALVGRLAPGERKRLVNLAGEVEQDRAGRIAVVAARCIRRGAGDPSHAPTALEELAEQLDRLEEARRVVDRAEADAGLRSPSPLPGRRRPTAASAAASGGRPRAIAGGRVRATGKQQPALAERSARSCTTRSSSATNSRRPWPRPGGNIAWTDPAEHVRLADDSFDLFYRVGLDLLTAGCGVIMEAACVWSLSRHELALHRELADLVVVECRAPATVLRDRYAGRQAGRT